MPPWRDNGTRNDLVLELQSVFERALLRGDEGLAELAVREAIETEVPEAEIDDLIITPSLHVVGELWERGQLSIGEEHLATEIALRVLTLERELFRVQRRRPGAVVILSTVAGELHEVGVRMATSLLLHAGFDAKHLGPSVPAASLGQAVEKLEPAVVALGITMPRGAEALDETIAAIGAARPGTSVVLGGAGVAHRAIDRPGLRTCRHVSELVPIVDGLVQRAALN